MNGEELNPSLREKAAALYRVAGFRPRLSLGILALSLAAAVLEGIGLSFLVPVIELARGQGGASSNGLLEGFQFVYQTLGVPFELPYVITGIGLVLTVRYTLTFVVAWLQAILRTTYIRDIRTRAFQNALDAEVAYFDQQGSDEILNAIITQSRYSGRLISNGLTFVEQGFMAMMYGAVALYLAPVLTLVAGVILGVLMLVLRKVLEPGFDVGDRVADANEKVQTVVQAGMQGIRDIKLFSMSGEVFRRFGGAIDQYTESRIRYQRNQAAMQNIYELMTAVVVLLLIYLALTFTSLSLAGLGVFLFAMFRLAPRASNLNNVVYRVEGDLPHLIRTQQFIDALANQREPTDGDRPLPDEVREVAFRDVGFAYEPDEPVLRGISFTVEQGEFIAFVGSSGAGKSTIVSLLTRMYDPDHGSITANGTSIELFDTDEWRSRVAVVRQNPHLFNDTLRFNLTVGNREASQEDIEEACETAQVTEFLDDLPSGYDTVIGDDGVRLSGGQRQRVAVARALLKDADVLVLDEATSDLDTTLEERVHDGIEGSGRDQAVLVIAHRLSTVIDADRIHTMEDGRITETGTHNELIANNGKYAQLYEAQAN